MNVRFGIVNSSSVITTCGLEPQCERRGVSVDAAFMICESLALNCTFSIFNSSEYGDADSNGVGTGMVGAIQRGLFDTSTPLFSLTYSRFRAVTFSQPMFYSDVFITTRAPDLDAVVDVSIIKSFQWEIWLTFIISLLTVATSLSIFDVILEKMEQKSGFTFQWIISVFTSRLSSMMTNKYKDRTSRLLPYRLISISWTLVSMVFTSALTSKLFSQTVTSVNSLPYTDFESLVQCLEDNRCHMIQHALTASYLEVLSSPESETGRRFSASLKKTPPIVKPAMEIPSLILAERNVHLVWMSSRNTFSTALPKDPECKFFTILAPYQESWNFPIKRGPNNKLEQTLNKMSGPFCDNGWQLKIFSNMLMLVGIILGFCLWVPQVAEVMKFLKFNAQIFFIYLLPPIVLDAGYSFKHRAFNENLGTILLYAILGTVLNVLIIGPSLYGLHLCGLTGKTWSVSLVECLMFSTIIAATDPVAALAIFQRMGVHKMLYFLVFGESLFNDGIAIVLYYSVGSFLHVDTIGIEEIGIGIAAFVCICLGSCIIGILCGLASAFVTRFSHDSETLEPMFIFGFAYLSYLIAQLFDFSGMISLICCAVSQVHYAFENLSPKSLNLVQQCSKLMCSVSESLTFIMLAAMAVIIKDSWVDFNVGFAVSAIVLCLIVRFLVTYSITYCVNRSLVGFRQISYKDQFIQAYGGLRGPITFSLAFSLEPTFRHDKEKTQHIFLTSALVVIFFTTFLQGMTMKLLVQKLDIQLDRNHENVFTEINTQVTENVTIGIECIINAKGSNYLSAKLKGFSRRYLRPLVNKDAKRKYGNVKVLGNIDNSLAQ